LFPARAREARDPEDRHGPEMTNETFADRVVQIGRQHPPRTPARRAAGMAYAALITTKTPDAARRALSTFGDAGTRADAAAMLDQIARAAA
jgi:hypothetical protein